LGARWASRTSERRRSSDSALLAQRHAETMIGSIPIGGSD
jgi:hypothetical protein